MSVFLIADDPISASATWAEVPGLAGRTFRGSWFSASPERNGAFDEVTYVHDNVHQLDGGHFPDGLMEGFYVLSLLDHLVNEVVYVDDPRWSGWNYGLDRVRFVSPLTVADRFRVHGTIREITARGENYLVLLDCAFEVEGRNKPAMVAAWRVLWTREK
ncbi:hypothetical protein ACFY36_48895 [Actinoplanes sp. NPDC000266]